MDIDDLLNEINNAGPKLTNNKKVNINNFRKRKIQKKKHL